MYNFEWCQLQLIHPVVDLIRHSTRAHEVWIRWQKSASWQTAFEFLEKGCRSNRNTVWLFKNKPDANIKLQLYTARRPHEYLFKIAIQTTDADGMAVFSFAGANAIAMEQARPPRMPLSLQTRDKHGPKSSFPSHWHAPWYTIPTEMSPLPHSHTTPPHTLQQHAARADLAFVTNFLHAACLESAGGNTTVQVPPA